MKKILVIRFSSFGDVLQSLSVAGRLAQEFPGCEIHFVTREEYESCVRTQPQIARTWTLKKGSDWRALKRLGSELKAQHFTHIYDSHNNLRSRLLSWQLNGFLGWRVWTGRHLFLRRSMYRWRRFMLLRFHRNLYPKPFPGQFALLEPLQEWGIPPTLPMVPQMVLPAVVTTQTQAQYLPQTREFVALAPSAAYPLKRWPLEYFADVIRQCPDTHFVILGGPEDEFLQELVRVAPERVVNLAGRLSLLQSACVISLAKALVANDTGLMHVAEQIGKPCLALMGPAPFGYPARLATQVFELELSCRPCSKHGQGPCVNPEFHKCLRDIPARTITSALTRLIRAPMDAPLSHKS